MNGFTLNKMRIFKVYDGRPVIAGMSEIIIGKLRFFCYSNQKADVECDLYDLFREE